MNASPLQRLAAAVGVAPDWYDIGGRRREVSDEGLRAVVGALGYACASESACEDSLEAIEVRRWQRRLPPVCIGREGSALSVRLTRPAAESSLPIDWTLHEESGRIVRGEAAPGTLTETGHREIGGEPWVEATLVLPEPAAAGYHRLEVRRTIEGGDVVATSLVVHAPARCHRPAALDSGAGLWGLTVQLYGVRSRRNWGIGDFTDLLRLIEQAAANGAAFVGLNPLHAATSSDNAAASPYSPSSRRFLNSIYLDVESIPEYAECDAAQSHVADPDFQAQIRSLRGAELVDYPAVAAAKHEVLRLLFESFCKLHRDRASERGLAFARFREERAGVLDFARFEAIGETLRAEDAGIWGWPAWPEWLAERDPEAAAAGLDVDVDRIDYHVWLQWNAEQQLGAAAARAEALGMPIGVYTDLALSASSGGADTWIDRDLYVANLRIGAPPDDFNAVGQDWGLPPLHPQKLHESGYRPFVETLRANMRFGGALRIDHVMALYRLFMIPAERSAADGTYVHFDLDALSAILALESNRNRCVVIGEDLGTVPDEVRKKLGEIGALGYRVLYFEKSPDGAYKPPEAFDRDVLTVVSTHDLPTLVGFWKGTDLEHRSRNGLFPNPEARERQIVARAQDRAKLLVALEKSGLAPPETELLPAPEMSEALCEAIHLYIARSPSRLVAIQAEDLLGETEQANLPGTTGEHPNWRRRLRLELGSWNDDARARAVIDAVADARPRPAADAGPRRDGASSGATAGLTDADRNSAEGTSPPSARIPRATYRVQLNSEFRFGDLESIVPYLDTLGVSHCYCSPYLKARPGSKHGYDIVDHTALNPEIGSREDLDRLSAALDRRGMGQILDVVPNHMAVMGRDNDWWLDVLENGLASTYAPYFDIDWHPLKHELDGKVLVPVLGDHYGNVLDEGELELVFDGERGTFAVEYYEHRFPIDPREYPRILEPDLDRLRRSLPPDSDTLSRFESLISALAKLPPHTSSTEEARLERARDREINQSRLAALAAGSPDIARYIADRVRSYNGDEHYPADIERLHELLEAQAYRLSYWRVAADEINYRRFFDVNELAALRQENAEVFESTHALVLELVESGQLDGLRIDHPDGLYDPRQYCRDLQQRAGATAGSDERPLYLLVEKILAHGESLREDWPVHGTTGCEFTNLMTRFLTRPAGIRELEALEEDLVGDRADYADVLYRSKRLIMQTALASELAVLVADLDRLAEQDPHTRDFGLGGLRNALLETIACYPVYRTYIVDGEVSPEDEAAIDRAIASAKARSEAADTTVFDFLRDVLLNRSAIGRAERLRAHVSRFCMQLQQYTSPVAAKGMEDTAFYRYTRLVSLNEVGGTPERPCASTAAVHAANAERSTSWPHSLLASSTHDTKRSEDLRARVQVLSETAGEWRRHVEQWMRLNDVHKAGNADGPRWPDRGTEYFLYQTLLGAWPLVPLDETSRPDFIARMRTYMEKAVKEAKVHTSWINPNEAYEAALADFVEALLDPSDGAAFLADFEPFAARIARLGLYNALSQLVLKLTSPGVPDIYQGNELWRFDLVDPDNRRPVDFDRRSAMLAELERTAASSDGTSLAEQLMSSIDDGRIKLFLIWRLLALRREMPTLFDHGDYRALDVHGDAEERVLAFMRRSRDRVVIVTVLRHFAGLTGEDGRTFEPARLGDITIAAPREARACRDVLWGPSDSTWPWTEDRVRAEALFTAAPVAVWASRPAGT